ncbi:flagellar M-ring protein FliF [beta proteobacterium AAP51]|nr:flagellar M-ring protein FliF [beta proteobacterium AAP51]
MDTAVATATPTTLVPATPGMGARWQALPVRTQLGAMIGMAALLAVVVYMALGAKDSHYRPLYTNISDKDGGQIIGRLAQMNVPYKVAEGGSVIMVPADQVHALRMKLAAAGLNVGGSHAAGYELLDKDSFGQTQGQERMKFKRVTEGELTTSIQSLESVKSARVHLALPQQNGFFREQQKPSASVVLTLHPGRTLDRNQVAGIVSLVSTSVPELNAKAVSVVDSTGALLSGPGDEEAAQGLDSQQLQYRRELEAGLAKRVMALLEPVVGSDNVRVSVTGDIDFNQVMQTAEAYRPNQGEGTQPAIREQRTEESTQPGSATPTGVPGAQTNQPPTPPAAPINGPAQALQGAQAPGATGGAARREAATRFEVDKTVTVTRNAVGSVRRLSAAVVVNNRSTTDAKGKTTSAPLSEKEIEQITALVQQGIGFNSERGDVVKVVNAPFRTDTPPPVEEIPLWQQPWLIDLLKTAAAPLALALVALLIITKLIRPAFTAMTAPPPPPEKGSQLDEVVAEEVAPPPPPPLLLPTQSDRVEQARALAKANPAAVANIVRGWVNGETA